MKFSPATEQLAKAKSVVRTNKETNDIEADSAESQKNMSANTVPNTAVQDHGNKGGDFDQQLKEIDSELGIYEDPQNLGLPTNPTFPKENSNSFDMGKLRNELAPN
nr:hypothetical protein CFP56_38538 [Quercus suber]